MNSKITLLHSFLRFQPIGLRIWHWLNAAVVTGLLLTVALRKTLFGIRANSAMIQAKAAAAGVTAMTPKLAKDIANGYIDRLWEWHVFLGYSLGVLLLLRILVIFAHKECPWRHFRLGLAQYQSAGPQDKRDSLHYVLVRSGYLAFYIAALFMITSGLTMIYAESLHLSDAMEENIHDVHETFQWFFIVFVGGHIGGVIMAELGKYRGLISNMIHGGDRPPPR